MIPLKEHGFFKGTTKARFLMTKTSTSVTMFTRAINSVTPIQIFLRFLSGNINSGFIEDMRKNDLRRRSSERRKPSCRIERRREE